MKVGDLVLCKASSGWPERTGIVVGFNEKGEGGKDFVHILVDNQVRICMSFDVFVVNRVKDRKM